MRKMAQNTDALTDPEFRRQVQALKDVTAEIHGVPTSPVVFSIDRPPVSMEPIHEQGLRWVCHDTRFVGMRNRRLWWCADSDGYCVVRLTPEGYKLLDQGTFVNNLGTNLQTAIAQATNQMRQTNPEMFAYLGGDLSQQVTGGDTCGTTH